MKTICKVLMCTIAVLYSSSPVSGGIVLNATEVGGDVFVDGFGAFDLTGLASANASAFAGAKPNEFFLVGPATTGSVDVYQGTLNGPTSIGFGTKFTPATMGVGDLFGLHFAGNFGLALPDGYISGTELDGHSVYTGQTLSSLGLSSGSYSWTLGQDTVELRVVAVPEPTSIMMLAVVGGFCLGRWALRKPKFALPSHDAIESRATFSPTVSGARTSCCIALEHAYPLSQVGRAPGLMPSTFCVSTLSWQSCSAPSGASGRRISTNHGSHSESTNRTRSVMHLSYMWRDSVVGWAAA